MSDLKDELIQIRPYWDAHNNKTDVNRWSKIHPRFQDHDGCVVDLGCFGWHKDFNKCNSHNWSGYFFGKKRVIGVDPQEHPHPQAELFKGFVLDFNGKANLSKNGIGGDISVDSNGIYDVISWQQFKLKFNIEKISILKVNIEAAEVQLFQSFSKSDFDHIDQIAVSFHDWLYPQITSACQSIILKIINNGYECIDLGIYGWKLFIKK